MSLTTTLNTIKQDVANSLNDAIKENAELNFAMTRDEVEEALNEACSLIAVPEVIYYSEAWHIVSSHELAVAEDTIEVDFSHCNTAQECVMEEAQLIYVHHFFEAINEVISEMTESLYEMIEKANEIGRDDGDITISVGSIYGWAAHNYETNEGTCVWSDEVDYFTYNPALLEGELWAIEKTVNGLTFGSAWNPAA